MICDLCKQPIPKGNTHYLYVMGWEKQRKQGGGNALALRRVIQPVRYACVGCITVRETHKHPTQEASLFDE